MSELYLPFRVIGYLEAEARPDGTGRRNNYLVTVEVAGALHEVEIRRSNGIPRVQPDLKGHPLAADIEKAAKRFVFDDLRQKIEIAIGDYPPKVIHGPNLKPGR